MNNSFLLSPFQLGNITLNNRVVMSPMTRSRAIGNIPHELAITYYQQRANAGLILTEGTSPSPNGLGYSRIPGIFDDQQVSAWKKITDAVHAQGGKIFVQLMHTGRISHQLNIPAGATILAPSAVKPAGKMYTDQAGLQDFPEPRAMTEQEIVSTKAEFVNAAQNAIRAGFDGVEFHGANGYLIEQFLSPVSNRRTDSYGGNIENRCRFILELIENASSAIGKERLGIRLSPYGVASDMPHYPEIEEEYTYLAEKLNDLNIAYAHLADHSSMGAPPVPDSIKRTFRNKFRNALILSGGYKKETAEADLQNGHADLIGFAKPFINNPDLVVRFRNSWPLSNNLDVSTFYTPGEKGYIDYEPYHQSETANI